MILWIGGQFENAPYVMFPPGGPAQILPTVNGSATHADQSSGGSQATEQTYGFSQVLTLEFACRH